MGRQSVLRGLPVLRWGSLRRDDGFHADGVVDEFEEIRLLRRIGVIHEKTRGDLPTLCVKHVPCVRATDAPSPCDHLPPVPVVAEKFNDTFHTTSRRTLVIKIRQAISLQFLTRLSISQLSLACGATRTGKQAHLRRAAGEGRGLAAYHLNAFS